GRASSLFPLASLGRQRRGGARLDELAQRALHLAPEDEAHRFETDGTQLLVGGGEIAGGEIAAEAFAGALEEELGEIGGGTPEVLAQDQAGAGGGLEVYSGGIEA